MTTKRTTRRGNDLQVEQRTLIRRALLGLVYWLRGRAFRLPFCDYLKIYLGNPEFTIVTLWSLEATNHPVFSTHPEIETTYWHDLVVPIPQSRLAVACYNPANAGSEGDMKAKLQLESLFAHPDFTTSQEGKLFAKALTEAVNSGTTPLASKETFNADQIGDPYPWNWDAEYNRLHVSINTLFSDLPHYRLERSSRSAVNLFMFVFTAREASRSGHLPRTVLTAEQIAFLRGRTKNADDLDKQFLQLFGQEAEEACRTGTVILGAPRKRAATHSGDEPSDIRELEQLHRIYVPIHVEGFPWIVLLKFLNSEETRWSDTFHHYHDVIPRVAAMLRTEAKALYLDLVERVLVDEIAKADLRSFVLRFNARSAGLLCNLPFPHVCLTEPSESGVALDLPGGQRVYIATKPNRFFNPEWTYDPLGGFDVKEACERAKIAFAKEEEQVRARFLGHRHSIVNMKPGPLLHVALLQDEDQLSGKARTFVADAEKTTEVLFATLEFVMGKTPQPLQGKSIAGILAWLKEHESSGVGHASLTIDPAADFLPAQDTMEDVFLVLWNLWHNAAQRRGDFTVHLRQLDGSCRVVFSQESEWPNNKRQWVDFLNGVGPSPNAEREKRGLEIVERSLQHLGWNISVFAAPKVQIIIEIPQKEQS